MEQKYSEAAKMFNSLKQEYDVEMNKVGSLQAMLEETITNATKTEKYIVELEEKLHQAKQYMLVLNSNKVSLQKDINSRKDRQAVRVIRTRLFNILKPVSCCRTCIRTWCPPTPIVRRSSRR